MKKLILIIISLQLIFSLQAQKLSYTSNDLAQVGDSFDILKIRYDNSSMISINDVAPNKWNFSNIIANTEDTVLIISKDNFSELSDLPNGTMLMQQDDQSYMCILLNGDQLQMLGLLVNIDGTLIPMILPEPQTMLSFPLTIGNENSSSIIFPLQGTPEDFGLDIPFHDSVRFDVSLDATTIVQDTGVVSTFQYNQAAFRIANTTIFSVDLWALPSFGSWYLFREDALTDTTKQLQYYTPDYGIPMVELYLTWTDSIMSYKMITQEAQYIASQTNNKLNLYPNPISANQKLFFDQKLSNISIFDITGRLVMQKNGVHNFIKMPELPDGYYILKSEQPIVTKRIIVD